MGPSMARQGVAKFKELTSSCTYSPAQSIRELGLIRARARAYWGARGMDYYELKPRTIAESIALSRSFWPNLKNIPAKLTQNGLGHVAIWK